MPELLGRCPVCQAELHVVRLECSRCQTTIEGHFSLSRFQRLSPAHLAFLDTFIKNRGVIRDVERELGLSYPTVRGRLDDLIRALGYEVHEEVSSGATPDEAERRRQVLERLGQGEIDTDEAIKLLRR